jgi:hypothetical protein
MNIFTIIGVLVVVILVAGYFGSIALAFDLANPVLERGAGGGSIAENRGV